MSKLKIATCPKCGKKIKRHDALRVSVRVAEGSTGQGVYKDVHLACSQEDKDGG